MKQSYKMIGNKTITRKRYFFEKGYKQVPMDKSDEVRKKIMDGLGIKHISYFSTLLNKGFIDISMYRYEVITEIFSQYGITDVWDIKNLSNYENTITHTP